MGAVPKAVPQAIPSAVPPSTQVKVDKSPQLGPFTATRGSQVIPQVPVSDPQDELQAQPRYGEATSTGHAPESGGKGAPSVPAQTTALFRKGPADPHYLTEDQGGRDPYARVNNPPTRGRVAWVKTFMNHVFNGRQNVDNAGWQQSSAQQRTSVMRVTLPPAGDGYSPASSAPHQLPQQPNTYKFAPVTGNDQPGPRVLNRTTYGAGQTAGGQGGSLYSPAPGPPDTTSTASSPPPAGGGMPTWG